MRVVILALASLATLVLLGALFVVVRYNPSKLPLERIGLTDYTILDSDESNQGLRSADLLVAPKTCALDDLRTVARNIKEQYQGYDYVDILFYRRFAKSPCKAVAVVGLTQKGREQVDGIEGEPLSGSRNGDGVFLFEVTR